MNNTLFSLLLCLVGVLDAGYLTYTRFAGTSAVCFFAHGCETVAQSPYSIVFGIPLSVIGLVLYILSAGLFFVLYKNMYSEWLPVLEQARLFVVTLGFVFSMYFTYLQAYVINAWCTYCIISALLWTLLFVTTLITQSKK
jgi:uncharacterized membrane protein